MKLFLCSHFSSVGSMIKEEIENKKQCSLHMNTSSNSEVSFPVYHAFSPQKSMAKNKKCPRRACAYVFSAFPI